MAPLRLRHPGGVSTIQVLFDGTVQDLQQEIYAVTDILPSSQDLKSGYPPKSLTVVPELPFSSLGLKAGEQVIVAKLESPAEKPRTSNTTRTAPSSSSPITVPPRVPSAAAPKPTPAQGTGVPEHVEVDGSFLVHRVVPDDNSCLFSSVALVFEQDMTKASRMREIVGKAIAANPTKYSAAILGMDPSRYIATITSKSTWGGAIELTILAAHFKTEIASIDVETGRIDLFPAFPDSDVASAIGQQQRCLLIYSGIHYDAATLAPMADAPAEWHQTVFPIVSETSDQDPVLKAAKSLAAILRGKRAYTNTNTFDLKCEVCGEGIKGEKNARQHAQATGHAKFGEY